MSYVALYRKYRPINFDEIVGQKAIVTTLKNQIKSGKVGHAYLFCGMRGTGKTSTARVLAKALNCDDGPTNTPCNICPACEAINNGSMMDVIEMDAASNRGIDDIRELREKVNFAPSEGRYKIYIIDEVHMLTTEAFNALLKTLEEPPGYVVFILATTEPNKLPQTILSRCMRFDFSRVSTSDIVERLRKITGDLGVEVEDKALTEIAVQSQGSVRDSLSLLDKALAFGVDKLAYDDILTLIGAVNREVFYDISRAVIKRDTGEILNILDKTVKQGKDLYRFLDDLLTHFRDLLLTCIEADRKLVDLIDEDYRELQQIVKNYTRERLLSIIDILNTAANDVKWSSNPRIVVESALVKLALPPLWEGPQGFESRIQELERQIDVLQQTLKDINNSGISMATVTRDETPISYTPEKQKPIENEAKVTTKELAMKESESIKTEEQSQNDQQVLSELQKLWPDVIKTLGENRKMVLQTIIRTGKIRPVKLEKNRLYLLNAGDKVFEEKVEAEKKVLEETIKSVSGFDVSIKTISNMAQFEGTHRKNESELSQPKSKVVSDEQFEKNVLNFFDEEIVTFKEE